MLDERSPTRFLKGCHDEEAEDLEPKKAALGGPIDRAVLDGDDLTIVPAYEQLTGG